MEKLGMKIWDLLKYILRKVLVDILNIKWFKRNWNSFLQFVKFGIVGLSNTAISYFIYVILVFWKTDYIVASMTGFFISVINSFYWNNKYVFKNEERTKQSILKSFLKTLLSYSSTGLVLQNILLYIWIDICGIHKIIAPLLCLFITIPLNYILNKLWAFKK